MEWDQSMVELQICALDSWQRLDIVLPRAIQFNIEKERYP